MRTLDFLYVLRPVPGIAAFGFTALIQSALLNAEDKL
jgi:hypothetical protein